MTVSTTKASDVFPGNGSSGPFSCEWRIFDDTDVIVSRVNQSTGADTPMVLNTDYTISGAGDQAGFTVATVSPVASGTSLYVRRAIAYKQPTDFTNQGAFFPTMHEDAMDRLEMQIQQQVDDLGRSLMSNAVTGNYEVGNKRITGAADAVDGSDLTTLGQVSQLVTGAAGGITPTDVALKSELSASGGASTVGFIQTGTGAVATEVNKKMQRLLDLFDFVDEANWSAALAGTFDLSPALGLAIDEALKRGLAGVRLPAGALRLNTTVSKVVSGINGFNLEGAGMGATKLVCYDASGSGLLLSVADTTGNWWMDVSPSNGFRFANFSVCSTGLNIGYGIEVKGGALSGRIPAPLVFDHIETRQYNSLNGQAFAAGVHLLDAAQSIFNGCRFFAGGITNSVGIGVRIEASASGIDPTDHHFVNCKWVYGDVAVWAGNYIEGLWFSGCLAVGINNAVKYVTTTGESGLGWVGGHINSASYAFNLGNVFDVQISGTLIYAKNALLLNVGSNLTITGNTFYGIDASGTAINLQGVTASTRGTLISSNQFSSFLNGILIDSASHGVTVGLNGYANVTTRVSNSSTDSYVVPRVYASSTVKTLTGGATSETVDITIPSGVFSAKPENATLQVIDPVGMDMIGFYAYADAASTATNVRFRVVKRDGTALPSGAYRFGMTAYR